MPAVHQWSFFRAGGFDQVQLNTGADLLALSELDQKLWVALGCPTRGIEFDNKTLDLIDSDADGHVRANEVLAAIDWAASVLRSPDLLLKSSDQLLLADISDSDEGKQILASAKHILKSLAKTDAAEICLADVQAAEQLITAMEFNGDGVISPKHLTDEKLRHTVEQMMECVGGVADLSGELGINQVLTEQFFTEVQAVLDWQQSASADILLLGEQTELAVASLLAVKDKINDYFTRCMLAEYDVRAAEPLNRKIEDYAAFAAQSLSSQSSEIASFPLATIAAGKALPLCSAINPAWQEKLNAFRTYVVQVLLGNIESLTQSDWQSLCARFDAFIAWQSSKPANHVEQLESTRLQEILQSGQQATLMQLIEQDKAVAAEINAIHAVERLLRYQRDLYTLVNNFVSFRDFYTGKTKAIFQVGTLYLDGRSCDLCVRIDDVAKHAGFANSSGICLAYCECVRGTQKMTIAAAFTAGDSDYLTLGRNGVFYDRKGQDWDACIVRILDHPISIRQAFWSPYKKLVRMIGEQLQKMVAAKAGGVDEKLLKASTEVVKPVADATTPKPAFDVGKFAGIFAAIGLAVAAIGGMVHSIVTAILSLKLWQMPLALAGLILVISGPSMLLAAFKLKRRNLAPVLDANGWAINTRARINIAFGTSLTSLAQLPPGSNRSLIDPYADKSSVWPVYLILLAGVVLGLWFAGVIKV